MPQVQATSSNSVFPIDPDCLTIRIFTALSCTLPCHPSSQESAKLTRTTSVKGLAHHANQAPQNWFWCSGADVNLTGTNLDWHGCFWALCSSIGMSGDGKAAARKPLGGKAGSIFRRRPQGPASMKSMACKGMSVWFQTVFIWRIMPLSATFLAHFMPLRSLPHQRNLINSATGINKSKNKTASRLQTLKQAPKMLEQQPWISQAV